MSPIYTNGDYVVTIRLFRRFLKPKPEQNVVFLSERYGVLIKKIIRVDYDRKTAVFVGTNSDSLSSDDIGEVDLNKIVARVILRIKS